MARTVFNDMPTLSASSALDPVAAGSALYAASVPASALRSAYRRSAAASTYLDAQAHDANPAWLHASHSFHLIPSISISTQLHGHSTRAKEQSIETSQLEYLVGFNRILAMKFRRVILNHLWLSAEKLAA